MTGARISIFIIAVLFSALAAAQERIPGDSESRWDARPKLEIVAGIAMGHLFRFDDEGFGNHLNFGVGVEFPVWGKLRIGADINRTFGLSPKPAECGAILSSPGEPMPCFGTAREGVASAAAGSVTVSYFFGEGRIQPYLVGGISIMGASEYRSTSIVHDDYVEFQENRVSSTGIGPTIGAGLRASINRHLSIRPEIRFSDATALSSLNLSQWRLSVGFAYAW